MVFSEDSRVKIPCILHLQRLGYCYLSLKDAVWDIDTNIFPAIFNEASLRKVNVAPLHSTLGRVVAPTKGEQDECR